MSCTTEGVTAIRMDQAPVCPNIEDRAPKEGRGLSIGCYLSTFKDLPGANDHFAAPSSGSDPLCETGGIFLWWGRFGRTSPCTP